MINKESLVEEFCNLVMHRGMTNQHRANALWWEVSCLVDDDKIKKDFEDAWIHYRDGLITIDSFGGSVKILKDHILGNDRRLL